MLKHCVFLNFKSNVTKSKQFELIKSLSSLKNKIDGIVDFDYGNNLDFELSSDFNLFYLCCLLKKTFHQLNIPLTIVKSGGIADNKRQQVYSENISIMKMHNKIKNILKIYILKIFQSFKDLFKLLLPQRLINILLKMKYNKRII